MQDFTAVPADSGPASSKLRVRRLTGGERRPEASKTVRPGLLDTRFVLAELSRLRAPARRPATYAAGERRA